MNAGQIISLLKRQKAVMESSHRCARCNFSIAHMCHRIIPIVMLRNLPGKTILEQKKIESKNGILHMKGDCVGLPHDHTMF